MLQSALSRARNPLGLRRWGNWDSNIATTNIARIAQTLATVGQVYAIDNRPLFLFTIPANVLPVPSYISCEVSSRDLWERPAKRWFKVTVSGSGTNVLTTSGQPFVVTDPIVTSVKFGANVGDDLLLLDTITGDQFDMKVASVDLVGGNSVTVVPQAGGSAPPDSFAAVHEYIAYHVLDAFQIQFTVVQTVQSTDDARWVKPMLECVYYRSGQAPLIETYDRFEIRTISALFAEIPIVGDRFDVFSATNFKQVVSLFQVPLSRTPDEVRVRFINEKYLYAANTSVVLANVAVYLGDNTDVLIPLRPSQLSPQGAAAVLYHTPQALAADEFWTGSGDITVVPAGQGCPPGYENLAQLTTLRNPNYIQNPGSSAGALYDPVWSSVWTATYDAATGLTTFSSVSALPVNNKFRGSKNNTATFQLVWLDTVSGQPVRSALRIPSLLINDTTAKLSFTIAGDYSYRHNMTAYVFTSGLLVRTGLSLAGEYRKPFLNGTDATVGQNDALPAPQPAVTNVLVIDEELVGVLNIDDIITFTDEDGVDLSPVTIGPNQLGPSFRITAIDDNEVTVVDADPTHAVTNVQPFVTSSLGPPPVAISNFFRVDLTKTAHTHAVLASEETIEKARENGGHSVTPVDHQHSMPSETVVPPYQAFAICSKL